ncbi:hypothetical protein ADEAN_000409600 [Angomonas deanei]|uniref:Uncharacterized protein n=1 Tax=Angomonas deanei TaxID=59799 RepID=A0A7G2CCH9_9TRYP|nr:hypothetical protein ADEAN_000409600 [Angomonas deanei]
MPKIVYSNADLLALSVFESRVVLSPEQIEKFNIIESEITPPKKEHKPEKQRRGARQVKEERLQQQQERFNAPQRRGPQVNRNHETFEEGVRYELERNAEHQKVIRDTLDQESRKRDGGVQTGNRPEEDDQSPEELEKLMSSIAVTSTQQQQRSRFFNGENTGSNGSDNNNMNTTRPAEVTNQWKNIENAAWRLPSNQGANSGQNLAAVPGLPPGVVLNSSSVIPPNYVGPATVVNAPANTGTPINLAQLQAQVGGKEASQPNRSEGVNASDIEQMLFQQARKQQASSRPAPASQNPTPSGAINVADLEAMLLQKANPSSIRGGAPAGMPQQGMLPINNQSASNPMWMPQQGAPQGMSIPMMPSQFVHPSGQGAPFAGQPMMFNQPQMNSNGDRAQFMQQQMGQPMNPLTTNPQMLLQMQMQMQMQQQMQQQHRQ